MRHVVGWIDTSLRCGSVRVHDEHSEHSRRRLFAKDRELRRVSGELSQTWEKLRLVATLVEDFRGESAETLRHIAQAVGAEPTYHDGPLALSRRAALIKRPRTGSSRPGPDTEEVTLDASTP